MSPETRQAVLIHLMAAHAYSTLAVDLVDANANAGIVVDSLVAAQNELRTARHLLVDAQVLNCLETLRGPQLLSKLDELSALGRAVLMVR